MLQRSSIVLLLVFVIAGCNEIQNNSSLDVQELQAGNLLQDLTTQNLAGFEWLNKPSTFTTENNTLSVLAEKGTDFFNNPEDSTITSTAPFLYKEVNGDFIAKALVRPDFSSMKNFASISFHSIALFGLSLSFGIIGLLAIVSTVRSLKSKMNIYIKGYLVFLATIYFISICYLTFYEIIGIRGWTM